MPPQLMLISGGNFMDELDYSLLFQPHCNYRITKRIRQHWRSERFSYAHKPRPDYGFLLLRRGNILFESQNGQLIAEPGDIVFLSKGSNYEACILPQYGITEDFLINFDADIALSPTHNLSPVKLLNTKSEALIDQFRQMIQWSPQEERHDFRTQGQFCFLMDSILSNIRCCSREKTRILEQAQKLLTDQEDLSIRKIAALCGVSESGLRNNFTKAYGVSPQQYRINAKISKAKFLLESTDLSVYDIAEQLKFYDEAYFCKMFRKYVGCSPRKYITSKTI